MKRFSSSILLLLISFSLLGQVKDEKEIRIPASAFPEDALQLLSQLPENTKRLKYFKETDSSKTSFEAKFKYNRKRFSVEFTEDGILEDIEVIWKLKEIDQETNRNIIDYYEANFERHKLIKLQKQYKNVSDIGLNEVMQNALQNKQHTPIFYEIIAEVKTKEKRVIKEFTFNRSGHYISSRILKPSSYEHILY
ncbi:MAG: hypothetical protein EX254_10985 [Flavobacteriaceae bacterium]|nr:MAG: hypothetical protein EX254_10985 [Flavobacteriaceae bacterium]